MPRKKLRPENRPLVYAYDIKITGDVPEIVFQTAKAQRELWNWMATENQRLTDSLKDADKAEKKAAYEVFWEQAYSHVRNTGDDLGLPCWAKWQVYESFQKSHRMWAKKQAGIPSIKRGLRKINIEHRTQSGGEPISWLYEYRDKKHTCIRRSSGLARGHFSINDTRIPFEVVMHRPPDPAAILKRYSLCGQYEPAFREWRWKIILLVEYPPQDIVHGNAVFGLDLGYRRHEDGLRLGVLYHPKGSYEIYLPFNLANRSERKQMERFPESEATRDIRQVWEMQSRQDYLLEECKAQLREIEKDNWPEAARASMSGIVKMRAGGLRRLRKELFDAGISLEFFESWYTRHVEMSKRIRKAQIRIQATKNALYRNIAAWLSRHCAVLAWEDDLDLKEIAESDTDQIAIKEAQKYRQYAGLFRLRSFIREKMNDRIPKIEGAYSTQECEHCGGHIEPGPAVILTCENGHRCDQDLNAARVLFHRLASEIKETPGNLPAVDRAQVARSIRRVVL